MTKVHLLPPEIISKIAAGEIIERPASVVKELIENSLDAHATSIEIFLKDAGKKSISIKDNGQGIEKDDLKNIFLRHATSKINNIDDLYSIMSLGFRGEALYSIASISDVILKSKTKSQSAGWEIHMRGGEKINIKPCTFSSCGTEININELFFNTPARKKFLKSNTTEIHQILGVILPYTLLHKDIHFLFRHQDKTLFDLAPASTYPERIADALNLEAQYIIEDIQTFPDKKLSFHILLGDINITRARRDMQFIFINGRPVQNKSISFHINQIYRLIMPEGTSPMFSLFIDMPAENIDVNIHPTKREVKIKDEQTLCAIIRSICEQTLMQKSSIKQTRNSTIHQPKIKTYDINEYTEKNYEGTNYQAIREPSQYSYPSTTSNIKSQAQQQSEFFLRHTEIFNKKSNTLRNKFINASYIGTLSNKYILFGIDGYLLLVDQHAAQERITYEKLVKQLKSGTLEIQHLISPILIKLSPQELLVWKETEEKLNEIGFDNNQWDEETIAIHTCPTLINNIEKSIRELLSGETMVKCNHAEIARRACRSSIMSGDKITKEQAEYQRQALIDCLDPFTCPHGRPTIIEISIDFLDKQFLRT